MVSPYESVERSAPDAVVVASGVSLSRPAGVARALPCLPSVVPTSSHPGSCALASGGGSGDCRGGGIDGGGADRDGGEGDGGGAGDAVVDADA
jgi:hypothetical protein